MARTILNGTELKAAITTALRAKFTTQEIASIYKDPQKQGFTPPCLVVQVINLEVEPELRNRGVRSYVIDIRGHAPVSTIEIDSWAVGIAEKVVDAVRCVTVDGLVIKATSLEVRVESGVLHVIASYSFKVRYVEEAVPDMMTVTIEVE